MNESPGIRVDTAAADRYKRVIDIGKKYFTGTSLCTDGKAITDDDLNKITYFHKEVSPVNPEHPYKQQRAELSLEKGEIVDPSTYVNWEAVGGPLEHINLAMRAAKIISTELGLSLEKQNLIAAAAGLHDEGRVITHIFYTNELIGNNVLNNIGIRDDIKAIMPNEELMLTPKDTNFDEAIAKLSPEAVILRIADEFGKRFPKTDRLYQVSDYTTWDRQAWAKAYVSKPESGRPSDKHWRTKTQLHVDNVLRYISGLDTWVKNYTNNRLTLQDLTATLERELTPTLTQVATQVS